MLPTKEIPGGCELKAMTFYWNFLLTKHHDFVSIQTSKTVQASLPEPASTNWHIEFILFCHVVFKKCFTTGQCNQDFEMPSNNFELFLQ